MPELLPENRLMSFAVKKRLGPRHTLGCIVLGESYFGDEGIFNWNNDLTPDDISGIYQTAHGAGKQFTRKLGFYWPRNPQSVGQQANRNIFADAVVAWQSLTNEQKKVYRVKSYGLRMSGYNLFLSQYLQSH